MTDFDALIEYETTGNPTSAERLIIDEVKQALNDNTELKQLYLNFGPTVRHRIMNINSYRHNLKYGFTHKDLDDYNWLRKAVWEKEVIEFETTHTNHNPYIELGKGPNGKWSYGYSLTKGAAGCGCGVHVFREPFNSRKECLEAALTFSKNDYEKCLGQNDPTNYKEALINQVLKVINEMICSSNQLALF